MQIACDFAKSVSSKSVQASNGVDYQDTEACFSDLYARISSTIAFIERLKEDQFSGSESREIILRPGTPKEKKLMGNAYLLSYGLPQFFFHVTTAYGILRHQGVDLGKRDFMGSY